LQFFPFVKQSVPSTMCVAFGYDQKKLNHKHGTVFFLIDLQRINAGLLHTAYSKPRNPGKHFMKTHNPEGRVGVYVDEYLDKRG
jgi:hypothetical protein